tara:strand:+ start:1632 stop:2660 length:1029 start_codon:yes stop_codon:yes gene_type:complete
MNTQILRNFKIFQYLGNLRSDSIGFYFSFFLHFIILLFAIGLPNFFSKPPIYVPNIIPVEIINVTDVTSIPKKIEKNNKENLSKKVTETKKFNNSENREIEKIKIKEKPKVKEKDIAEIKTPKEDIIIEKKTETPIKLEKEKKVSPSEKVEVLPSKKIKPKIKPKPENEINIDEKKSDVIIKASPKPKPKPEFSIASMLKDLRNEKTAQKTKEEEEKEEKENVSDEKDEINKKNVQLSISEIDLLRQQLTSCWIAPAGAVIERGMFVKISAKIQQNRKIYNESVRIIDTNISKSNTFYGPITESAMRTLLNPDCIPLKLPEKKYNLWKNLTITFDYSIMKGY